MFNNCRASATNLTPNIVESENGGLGTRSFRRMSTDRMKDRGELFDKAGHIQRLKVQQKTERQ